MDTGLKILQVNTRDLGGAANACIRLHLSLLDRDVHSSLLLRKKARNIQESFRFDSVSRLDKTKMKLRKVLHELKLGGDPSRSKEEVMQARFVKSLAKGSEYFSFPKTSLDITRTRLYQEADIIHLHWVADFLDYPSFFRKNKKPVVWTLHDMGPFQGGTHYEEKYLGMTETGMPKENLLSDDVREMMRRNLAIKRNALEGVQNVNVVAPSRWLTNLSAGSELFGRFPHTTIPYGLNTKTFAPRDKNFSREIFGLPKDKICLLFVADNLNNYRKGFSYLKHALSQIENENVVLCAIGQRSAELPQERLYFLDRIEDDRMMSLAYSAADAFIIPSVEDNFPNTVLEALLCGTPVIGFAVGGIAEMVVDEQNGLLSRQVNAESLKETIQKFLSGAIAFHRNEIREKALEKYDLSVQARAYLDLYKNVLHNS